MALLRLEAPVQLGGRVASEVELLAEGGRETLFQALLVEEEGGLEGVESAGEKRGPGEDEAGFDGVVGGGVLGGGRVVRWGWWEVGRWEVCDVASGCAGFCCCCCGGVQPLG